MVSRGLTYYTVRDRYLAKVTRIIRLHVLNCSHFDNNRENHARHQDEKRKRIKRGSERGREPSEGERIHCHDPPRRFAAGAILVVYYHNRLFTPTDGTMGSPKALHMQ